MYSLLSSPVVFCSKHVRHAPTLSSDCSFLELCLSKYLFGQLPSFLHLCSEVTFSMVFSLPNCVSLNSVHHSIPQHLTGKKTKQNCFARYLKRELKACTISLSRQSRQQTVRLILYRVLVSMKFRDWQNFRDMNFISRTKVITGDCYFGGNEFLSDWLIFRNKGQRLIGWFIKACLLSCPD